MANIKSQKKRNLQNERRRERNKAVRSELKTRVKLATAAVESGADDADELVQAAQKRLGKAGAKGIIHKNQAARRTSRHDAPRPTRRPSRSRPEPAARSHPLRSSAARAARVPAAERGQPGDEHIDRRALVEAALTAQVELGLREQPERFAQPVGAELAAPPPAGSARRPRSSSRAPPRPAPWW